MRSQNQTPASGLQPAWRRARQLGGCLLAGWTAFTLSGPAWATATGYSIGLNFGADEVSGSNSASLAATDVAGVNSVAQRNWNNLTGATGTSAEPIVADNRDAAATAASVTVEWTSNNTWASTGRGEENNGFTGANRALMTGYLDTGNSTTSHVIVSGIPSQLTGNSYDVYVYALGGVAGRGGAFAVLNPADDSVIRDYKLVESPANPAAYVEDTGADRTQSGTYVVFKGLTASSIKIVGTTADGRGFSGTPRAPINAIQLVAATEVKPVVGAVNATARGLSVRVDDVATTVVTAVTAKLNGEAIAVQTSKNGTATTVSYDILTAKNQFFPSGSAQSLELTLTAGARTFVETLNFTVGAYGTVPAANKIAGTPTQRGLNVFMTWLGNEFPGRGPGDANSIANAETQLAGGFIDPSTGQPWANQASPVTSVVDVVNWDQNGGDIDGNNPDNFNSMEPAGAEVPNSEIPGVGIGDQNHISASITTYLNLTRGVYRMGVNSDDGFIVSTARGAGDIFGTVLGQFNGGRGASDTVFDFVVEETGVYPFRLAWWEGGGGANVEWYTVNLSTGVRTLVNGTGGVQAFANGQGGAFVKSFLPYPGRAGVARRPTIKAELVDGTTVVNDASIQLILNGTTVTPTIQNNGTTTTVSYTVPSDLALGSVHSGTLSYKVNGSEDVRAVPFSFTVRSMGVRDFPAGSFTIEAEHFDNNGQTVESLNTMPYTGSEFDGQGAVSGVDYNRASVVNDANNYRLDEDPNVPMDGQLGGTYPNGDPKNERGGAAGGVFVLDANFKLGWSGGGNWLNYTRKVPAGKYVVLAALSHGGTGPNDLQGVLSRVTSGQGTANQTIERLGTFNAPGTGGWGSSVLVPMKDANGADAVLLFRGSAATTLRFEMVSGDFDWFVLVPTNTPTLRPAVSSVSPGNGGTVNRYGSTRFTASIANRETAVNASTVAVRINGTAVAATVTPTSSGVNVSANLVAAAAGSTVNVELSYADNDSPAQTTTVAYSYTVSAPPADVQATLAGKSGVFVIEAEDFNFGSGQTVASVNTMPYLGGALNGRGAVAGVDYNRTGDEPAESATYRVGESPNVPMNGNGLPWSDRGNWEATTNFKIGWAGNHFYNYTRNIPAGQYNVYAGLSHGDAAGTPNRLVGKVERVTSAANVPDQSVEEIGTFNAPATGGWGNNVLVQLKTGDSPAVLTVGSGATTLRATITSADFDYLALVPVATEPPQITSIVLNANGSITIQWTGGGQLQAGPAIGGPWQTINGATSPYTFTPDPAVGQLYGRIIR